MHPRQASVLAEAKKIAQSLTAETGPAPSQPTLWKYTDQEGKSFYLDRRVASVRSPYSGKVVKAAPQPVGEKKAAQAPVAASDLVPSLRKRS